MSEQLFSAVRWNAISTLVKYGANFFQVIYIARVLGPEQFATITIILALVTVLRPLLDLGSSIAVIHFQHLEREEISTLYWLNLCFSIAAVLLLVALFPLLNQFYPNVAISFELILLLALHLVLYGGGQLFSALAEKELKFGTLAVVEISSAVTGVVAAVIYLELVHESSIVIGISLVSSAAIRWILLHTQLSYRTWIGLDFDFNAGKRFLKFGATSTTANSINTIYSQGDLFLGARFLAPATFGLYSLPRDIGLKLANAIINPIITRVSLPVIASSQQDLGAARRAYHFTVLATCSISFPVYLLLVLFADEVINILMTDAWEESADLLRMIAVWGLIRAAYNPIGYLCYAFGQPQRWLKWHVYMSLPSLLVIAYSLNYGVFGLVAGNIVLTTASLVLSWWYIATPTINSTTLDLLDCFIRPAFCSLAAFLPSYFVLTGLEFQHPYTTWAISLILFGVAYFCTSWLINRPFMLALNRFLRPSIQG